MSDLNMYGKIARDYHHVLALTILAPCPAWIMS